MSENIFISLVSFLMSYEIMLTGFIRMAQVSVKHIFLKF